MSNELTPQPFEFEGFHVRFVGTADDPEWVASDVIAILYPEAERSSYNKYVEGVPSEWKGKKKVLTPGGRQEMTTVYEAGLYSLIARSNSSMAVSFQKWVYEDVLPSIRETGSYSLRGQSVTLIPPAKERLENIRLGMDLMYELGGLDERTQLALKDIVRDILLEDKLKKPALPSGGRAEWPVSDRARHLGFKAKRKDVIAIGKTAAKLYRLRHEGEDPPKREQYVDGTTREVNCYGEADLDILDQAISLRMSPPAQLPASTDSDIDF